MKAVTLLRFILAVRSGFREISSVQLCMYSQSCYKICFENMSLLQFHWYIKEQLGHNCISCLFMHDFIPGNSAWMTKRALAGTGLRGKTPHPHTPSNSHPPPQVISHTYRHLVLSVPFQINWLPPLHKCPGAATLPMSISISKRQSFLRQSAIFTAVYLHFLIIECGKAVWLLFLDCQHFFFNESWTNFQVLCLSPRASQPWH